LRADQVHRYDRDRPFAATYSILAHDHETGELGAAVQSHWFSVGSVVIWGKAGVGVVATQSFVNPSFGSKGLGLLRRGRSPDEAVHELVASDEGRDMRQLAIMDRAGKGAAYTGKRCIPAAGHIVGKDHTVQANMMGDPQVWPAMSKAFRKATGPLPERMLQALEAAEAEGGDIRGRQSAAMLVVKGRAIRRPWEERTVDLRVDDHSDPVTELKRLLQVHRAYESMNQGDLAMEKGRMEEAEDHYREAEARFPENEEMLFWHAVAMVNNHRVVEGARLLTQVFQRNRQYLELARRIAALGLLRMNRSTIEDLGSGIFPGK
jgi:uncharacterized Ntn-hydrolase superfamily protein